MCLGSDGASTPGSKESWGDLMAAEQQQLQQQGSSNSKLNMFGAVGRSPWHQQSLSTDFGFSNSNQVFLEAQGDAALHNHVFLDGGAAGGRMMDTWGAVDTLLETDKAFDCPDNNDSWSQFNRKQRKPVL